MFVNFNLSNALLIVLSIPLFIFGITSITLAIILISGEGINVILKGLLLIGNGVISTLASIYAISDFRLAGLGVINILVLVPIILVGLFFIIDGIILILNEKHVKVARLKKKSSQILGIISIAIGIINLISFILLLVLYPDQPMILTAFWAFISIILIYFGFKSILTTIQD
jgi:hypothetical protein